MMGGLDGGRRLLEQDVSKPKSVGNTLMRFWPYFRARWFALVIVLVLLVASTWTQIRTPELIGQAVDCYLFTGHGENNCRIEGAGPGQSQADALAGLGEVVLQVVVLYVLSAAFSGLMFMTMTWAGQHALRDIRVDVFAHINRLSLGYYTRNEAGNIMARFTSDSETIQQVMGFALVSVLSGVLLIVWIVVKMLQTDVIYALLSLSVVPFMLMATFYFSNQARRAFRHSRQEMGSLNADLQENVAAVREAQAFNRESENITRFREVNAANRDANIRAATFTSALTPVLEALGYVAVAIVVVVGGITVLRDEPLLGASAISVGTVIVFLQYVQRFNQPIQQIATLWTNVQSAVAGGERIFALLDEKPDLVDKPDAKALPAIQGRVVFEDVWAEYETGEPVLRGVNLTAEAGQTIAIVGPTGAGKTTIINLIPRFYDPTRGKITIDGIDLREITAQSLRRQIGIVLQDSFLFSDTVMNNIRYGRLDATDAEVIEVAKLTYAHDFIERLPDGYQTLLGERGAGLSQGQRQLISIARAALMKPHILILDEATSSVDTRTEKLIQKALDVLLQGRTSFVIAHRLSTIRNADQVLVLEAGQIVERGTHQTLLEERETYYNLYMSQFDSETPA